MSMNWGENMIDPAAKSSCLKITPELVDANAHMCETVMGLIGHRTEILKSKKENTLIHI